MLVDGELNGDPLVSIYTVLRVETAGNPEDPDSTLWQPIKKGGAVLTVSQWRHLMANMEKIDQRIDELDGEIQ